MTLQRVCATGDVPEGGAVRVMAGGTAVCLVGSEGRLHALADRCSHAEVALSEGDVEDGQIECWLHGSSFDLVTGAPSGPPAVTPVPVYETTTDGDDVLVDVPNQT